MRRLCFLWPILLVIFGMVEKVGELTHMTTRERHEKIVAINEATTAGLNQMRPRFVAQQFIACLKEPHGLAFYQWDAPFNAQVALTPLNEAQLQKLKPLEDALHSLQSQRESLSLQEGARGFPITLSDSPAPAIDISHLPLHPSSPSFVTHPPKSAHGDAFAWFVGHALEQAQQQEKRKEELNTAAANFWRQNKAIDDQIQSLQKRIARMESDDEASRHKIEKWEIAKLLPASGNAIIFPIAINVLLALPDAYLDMVKNLMPRLRWAFRIVLVALVFLAASLIALRSDSIQPALWFLFLLPVAVSLFAGLCALVSWGFERTFYSAAPTLSVTSSAAITPFFYWASGKLTEHHLIEAILHRLPKSITRE